MRSLTHTSFGDPATVLAPGDSALPEPREGEVRIKTILSPIHNHDLWTVRGQYGYKPELPAIGGSEAVGTVDALGPGVEGVKRGQRVAVASVHGTWAEFFLAPAKLLVPVPDAINDEAAGQLVAMPLSAMMLLDFLQVKSGEWIMQNTANGAVGKMVAVMASGRGVKVINLVRRKEGIDELAAIGINNAVSTSDPQWKDQVRSLVGDQSIRAAVDSVGGQASGDLLSLLGDDSTLVSFGSMGGEPMKISSGDLIFKQAVIKGFWGAKVGAALSASQKQAMIGEILRLVESEELKLAADGIYSLSDGAKAAAASLQPGRKGKVMLRP